MYNVVSTATFKVVDQGEDAALLAAKYDMRKHVIITVEMPYVRTKTPFVRPTITHEVSYDFNKMSKNRKKSLLNYYRANDLDKVRDILNRDKVAYICCQGQYPNMINQIKQAIKDGIL